MRIRRVLIKNFRCLEDIDVSFDEVTTFLGPNGAGKSTILQALNWFFNGTKQTALSAEDVFQGDATRQVDVAVEFDHLSAADRERLGKYATASQDSVVIRKTWVDGVEKIIGRSRVFGPFVPIRVAGSAAERKALYQDLRTSDEELGLPAWSNNDAAMKMLADWESSNPLRLEEAEVEPASHFFGFAGQAVMAGLFDFIFVSADMRVAEEATDSRTAVVGRILEQAVDRSAADAELATLLEKMATDVDGVLTRHFATQLEDLSEQLTREVSTLASGRSVRISSQTAPPQAQRMQFLVNVIDQELETRVDRQGHGFQRALLIAALKLLAERNRGEDAAGVICLAIEEPELYQHPLQARLFAAVLRSLAEDEHRGVQVAYATHSPYFIEARNFHQIRRVTRVATASGMSSRVVGSDVDRVIARLGGFIDETRIRRQLDSVCLGGLGEGFFADVVLLVEGSTDRAVLSGAATRDAAPLLLDGIFVGEAGGKMGLLLPYTILDELGIPSYVLADNDSHLLERADLAKHDGDMDRYKDLKRSIKDSIEWNRRILSFFGVAESDWPVGPVASNLTFVDGGLEDALAEMWPGWAEAREELIETGVGFTGKDQATYEEAAICAKGEVPELLQAVLAGARALRVAA